MSSSAWRSASPVISTDSGGSLPGVLEGLDECFGRVPFLVSFEEKLRTDDALGIDNERARVRNAAPAFGRFLVANAVGVDGLAAGVGEEWIADGAVRGEAFEDGWRIVADGHKLAAGRLDFLQAGLQLDQLHLAVGSPIRRAVKDQCHRAFLEQRLEGNVAVVLVFEREGWRFLSDGQTDFSGRDGFGGDR